MQNADTTNDKNLKSWVASAQRPDCDFPIQNLPFGVFRRIGHSSDSSPVVGVAIGDLVLDLAVLEASGLISVGGGERVFDRASLNAFMRCGPPAWSSIRKRLSELLSIDNPLLRDQPDLREQAFLPQAKAQMLLPFEVAGYTDFYASKDHATNVGSMFRDPANALTPNWVHLPIGYNGRASTVVVSGTPVRRPLGQIKLPDNPNPIFTASRKLDIELEVGAIVGMDSVQGEPISMQQAEEMIFGYVLLNDWSARDIQQWEYVPLGPFQAKIFATSISPWVVTRSALEPFRVEGPEQVPAPLPYLRQRRPNNYDVHLEVLMRPSDASAPITISKTNFRTMYWSSAQQLVHHAVCGCAMQVGDLLGSGTISGPTPDSFGSLLELTWNGTRPLTLDGGVQRRFIEDGDELTLRGWCQGDGYRIGFGQVSATILPSHSTAAFSDK